MSAERDLGRAGVTQAVDRLRERVAAGASEQDLMISLGEAMEWCYSLEQLHVDQLGGSKARDAFDKSRRGSDDGKTQAALSWARGLFTHHLVPSAVSVVLRPTTRMPSSRGVVIIAGPVIGDFQFRPRDQLPKPHKPELDPDPYDRDQFYDAHVADKSVLPTVEAATAFLLNLP